MDKELDRSIDVAWLRRNLAKAQLQARTEAEANLDLFRNIESWMRYVRLPVGQQVKINFAADLDTLREAITKLKARATEEQSK